MLTGTLSNGNVAGSRTEAIHEADKNPRSLGPTFERRATVSLHRAKNLIDAPLAATRNADRK
jgi:hypothetical protein